MTKKKVSFLSVAFGRGTRRQGGEGAQTLTLENSIFAFLWEGMNPPILEGGCSF